MINEKKFIVNEYNLSTNLLLIISFFSSSSKLIQGQGIIVFSDVRCFVSNKGTFFVSGRK